jgi:DNA-binding MarR family transcriptional regulator
MLDVKESSNRAERKRGRETTNGRGETISNSIIHLLHRASQRASEIFALETRDFDLTARQYAVMTTIAGREGLSQTDLVRITGIDRSTLADVVQRLLKRGAIRRERTTRDGRTYAVTLSEEGRKLLQAIGPYARRADRTVLATLGADEDVRCASETLNRLIRRPDDHQALGGGNGSGSLGVSRNTA